MDNKLKAFDKQIAERNQIETQKREEESNFLRQQNENLEKFLFENPENRIKLTTVSNYRKNNSTKVSGYISSGFGYSSDGKTANNVFEKLRSILEEGSVDKRIQYIIRINSSYLLPSIYLS